MVNTDDPVKMAMVDLAKKYLTPSATTVDVERFFSDAGDIVTPDRNRLLPQNIKKILLTREGLPLINFRY